MMMAELPPMNQLQTDAEIVVLNSDFDYRRKLKQVDEGLVKQDLEMLKFLCQDIIPAAMQEDISRGIDLFLELEVKGKLGPCNLKYLAECLMGIQRADLLRKLGINAQEFSCGLRVTGEEVSPYRKLLLVIADELTKKDVSTMVYMAAPRLNLSKIKANRMKDPFQLFLALEHAGLLSPQDVSVLINLVNHTGRDDLLEKVTRYQGSLTGGCGEDEKGKAALKPQLSSGDPTFPPPGGFQNQMSITPVCPADPEPMSVNINPSLNPQGISLRYTSNLNYGPESEILPNIAVSSEEARIHAVRNDLPFHDISSGHQQLSNAPRFDGFRNFEQQQHLSQRMEHLHLGGIPDLPSYRMDRKPRGYCLIINNFKFYSLPDDHESRKMPDRHGTNVDAENLMHVFQQLGFIVVTKDNLTDVSMVQVCTQFAMENHNNFDCFACCILTHGVKDHLYGTNGRMTPINEITSCFKAQRCPGLRGKPKLFFIQACQGREKQRGFPMEIDAPRAEESLETIPNEADFLMGYATVPGFVSYRSKVKGSWYITTLCDNLLKYAERYDPRYDLLSIMTKVNEEVSVANAAMEDGRYKQIPAPMTTLRKKVYFR
ncbi:uncharacterized protein LOC135464628 [Liolophura sinensis]|uniref:uncharacterized protein LOC135464628 n=1 Tax=Liolophura sinensis TaxID=3198878 RepID=UPI003158A55B